MNLQDDDAIDALLRRQFEGPVRDDGFCDATMQQLPARRRRVSWPLWLGVVAGAFAAGIDLAALSPFHLGLRDLLLGEMSMPAITLLAAMAGMSLLACWWAIQEADHR